MIPVATFDGFDFEDEVWRVDVQDPVKVPAADVPKRHGALIQDVPTRGAKRVSFKGTIHGRDYNASNPFDGLHTRINQYCAKSTLYNKQLRIHNDRYLKAYPLGFAYEPREGSAFAVADFSWDFVCLDPFFYADVAASQVIALTAADTIADITNNFYSETAVVNNSGSLFVYPKVTVVCNHASSKRFRIQFDNLTTGKSWTYEFDYVGGTTRTVIVDAGNFVITNDGTDDFTNWQGTFVWLDAGNNNIRVLGSIDATYTIEWLPRFS